MSDPRCVPESRTVLVGAGVVGTAILSAHLDAGLRVTLADQDSQAIERAIKSLDLDTARWAITRLPAIGGVLPAVSFDLQANRAPTQVPSQIPTLVIESIAERLDVKQTFFRHAESWFDHDTILCSNTSTIRLEAIGKSLVRPERLCGMHFFMPVAKRDAVEIIRTPYVTEQATDIVTKHVHRLKKQPLVVADSPGFVVNRMLAPYLNQAMSLLCGGVSAARIEAAAIAYGMPMSPLELIDWIGTRTTFDAGRVYWQAFPSRLDPSPLIASLVKKKRAGRGETGGFYDYLGGARSTTIASEVIELAARYHRELPAASDTQLVELLAIPMWIEAKKILAERVVTDTESIEVAMAGGLGYRPRGQWHAFFDGIGHDRILASIAKWSATFRSMSDV